MLRGRDGLPHVPAQGVHDAHDCVQDHVVGVGAVDLVALVELALRGEVDVREAQGAQRAVGLGISNVKRQPGRKDTISYHEVDLDDELVGGKRGTMTKTVAEMNLVRSVREGQGAQLTVGLDSDVKPRRRQGR